MKRFACHPKKANNYAGSKCERSSYSGCLGDGSPDIVSPIENQLFGRRKTL